MTRIRHLEELESQRVSREKSGLNSGSGISGFFNSIGNNSTEEAERSKTLALHRAGILWYLNDSLKMCHNSIPTSKESDSRDNCNEPKRNSQCIGHRRVFFTSSDQ